MRIRASDVASATGGTLTGPDVEVEGASFDSRSVLPGQLFVPIVADRDGHDFIDSALAAGAGAYLTSRPPGTGTAIHVIDTARALMELAAWARDRLTARVVGITGSVGKTSTKDLVAGAIGAGRRVAANERSFNNEQGLPVTILGAPDDAEVLVLEMGMRGFGEIRRLCDVARPSIGVVTVVGRSHTGLVGGIDGVARAKRELVEALPADGTAVLNADDQHVAAMRDHTPASLLTFGTSVTADVRADEIELDELARARFTVRSPWGTVPVRLAVSGRHMVLNATAALAVAGALDVPLVDAADALATTRISAMRMDTRRAPSGATVINDAYNANPTSMRAALESLAALPAARHVAVLGEMAELDDPEAAHAEVAALAGRLGIELVAVGTDLYGVPPIVDPVVALGQLSARDAVLVKASRVGGLERFAAELLGEEGTG
ncbi:MAG TPA: UDP-N-acetylmuramoyl-tripeptide--D-alanyl-D-alanine ligase [Ilumatobacteraceae bacterium]|nr:UDP-N-acetylmuramoyl-tripeptide--D-alanyl-D-alanine ligase [Ilumatobacteraceae bacterium]